MMDEAIITRRCTLQDHQPGADAEDGDLQEEAQRLATAATLAARSLATPAK